MSFRTCWGRVEKFLVAGEQEIIHTKLFFFSVVSAVTCTYYHLDVDQRALVSTLPNLVSTHCPKTAQKVFWEGDYEGQEEEQVEDGNASE
ncbi:hypothetical protein Taro_011277 [Colocasia esculenta]|uniref:Uncharacterized protein n=1 Tax=Colocasia esculenta TaxID=4460 RepID=A0A843U5U5_COLES|nr:hypothetical protein [Colocasia esculenta]